MTPARVTLLLVLLVVAGSGPAVGRQDDAPVTGARIDRGRFAWQRRIPAGPAGVASLRLDLAALSHSRLADVRLVSRDGAQVPYLLEPDPLALRVTLSAPKKTDPAEARRLAGARNGQSVYTLALPFAHMPPATLVLETPNRVFERGVRLLARDDDPRRREREAWRPLASSGWRHADPETAAPPLDLDVPTLSTTDLRLVVDEGDNRPLPLERPVLEVRTWKLRFVRRSAEEMWLVYGRPDLDAPRYDLALLEDSLREQAATEVTPEPEAAQALPRGERNGQLVFWAVLVLAIAALLVLVARLVKDRS